MTALRVIACASFRRDGPSGLHDLARSCRRGEAEAVERVAAMVVEGLVNDAPELATAEMVTVVPMAGHEAGSASGAAASLAAALAAVHPTWSALGALERIADAPRAKDGGLRDADAEADTLRWASVPGDGPVVLVDDVVHTGVSLQAAWLAAAPPLRARLVALVAFRAED